MTDIEEVKTLSVTQPEEFDKKSIALRKNERKKNQLFFQENYFKTFEEMEKDENLESKAENEYQKDQDKTKLIKNEIKNLSIKLNNFYLTMGKWNPSIGLNIEQFRNPLEIKVGIKKIEFLKDSLYELVDTCEALLEDVDPKFK